MNGVLTKGSAQGVLSALESVRRGEDGALDRLFQEVYEDLHMIAQRQRQHWSGHHTLDTTSLLHESYLKLVSAGGLNLTDVRHFFAVASKAMRQILINYAKRQGRAKRGGDQARMDFVDVNGVKAEATDYETMVALSSALDQLAELDSRRTQVFEYRFFLGLGIEEVAELLDISQATVKRDWTLSAAFLRFQLEP